VISNKQNAECWATWYNAVEVSRLSVRTQVYRIGPRFNASVMRVDRRGSVDSGLSQVIRLGRASAPRVVRIAPASYDDTLQTSQTGGPQVTRRS